MNIKYMHIYINIYIYAGMSMVLSKSIITPMKVGWIRPVNR